MLLINASALPSWFENQHKTSSFSIPTALPQVKHNDAAICFPFKSFCLDKCHWAISSVLLNLSQIPFACGKDSFSECIV